MSGEEEGQGDREKVSGRGRNREMVGEELGVKGVGKGDRRRKDKREKERGKVDRNSGAKVVEGKKI